MGLDIIVNLMSQNVTHHPLKLTNHEAKRQLTFLLEKNPTNISRQGLEPQGILLNS